MIVGHSNLADLPHKEDYSDGQIKTDGYGQRRHPTRWMVQLPGETCWRRVYSCCISNAGTCYVEVARGWHVIE